MTSEDVPGTFSFPCLQGWVQMTAKNLVLIVVLGTMTLSEWAVVQSAGNASQNTPETMQIGGDYTQFEPRPNDVSPESGYGPKQRQGKGIAPEIVTLIIGTVLGAVLGFGTTQLDKWIERKAQKKKAVMCLKIESRRVRSFIDALLRTQSTLGPRCPRRTSQNWIWRLRLLNSCSWRRHWLKRYTVCQPV